MYSYSKAEITILVYINESYFFTAGKTADNLLISGQKPYQRIRIVIWLFIFFNQILKKNSFFLNAALIIA